MTIQFVDDAPDSESVDLSDQISDVEFVENDSPGVDVDGNFVEDSGDAEGDPVGHAIEALSAPEHWAPGDQERFNQLGEVDPAYQHWLLERYKSMEGDYTRKTQAVAEVRRQHEQQIEYANRMRSVLGPLQPLAASRGIDEYNLAAMMATWTQRLFTDPDGAMAELASLTGFQPQASEEAQLDELDPVDPRVQQQLAQIQQVTQQTAAQNAALIQQQMAERQRQQSEVQNGLLGQISEFASAKDENGRLLHPAFEQVKEQMAKMFQAGLVSDLTEAYQKAVALNPHLDPTRRHGAVRRAKRAASGVGGGGSTPVQAGRSLAEALAANFERLNNS